MPARNSVINAARHAQVSFMHNGQTYLLDATGGSRFWGAGNSLGNLLKRSRRKNHCQAPHLAPPNPQPQKILAESEVTIDITQEQLEHNKQTFEQQLINIYGCTDRQQLYELVVKMPRDDPIRRAVSLTMKSDTPMDEIKSTLKYIEAIMKAEDDILKRMGLLPYKGHPILYMAQNALWNITNIREG